MKIEVLIEEIAAEFIRRQPPETRKRLRAALHGIEQGKSFPEPLEDELDGFYKLKVDNCRLILQSESGPHGPRFKVVFAEQRKFVYELFSRIIGLE
jgi:mRNA-degrading endonuclease RelE of RelBE toxin-antitoxin system